MDPVIFFGIGLGTAALLVLLRRRFAEFPGQSPSDYADGFPQLDVKQCLVGEMVCSGAIFGPFGRVTSTFQADFDIRWEGETGVMSEQFHYNDGSTQFREWRITLNEDGSFVTQADDVPKGGRGVQAGMAVQHLYSIELPDDLGGHLLDTVDWMYLTPDGTIVNRSQFRKFGIKVAELVATIRPKEKL